MAFGLYVHVPFCRSRCAYCSFYSGEPLDLLAAYPGWVEAEAHMRGKGTSGQGPLTSVYIGGGSPSLLAAAGISRLLGAARSAWGVSADAEITLEVNPGSGADLPALRGVGVNRLSVGVQALDDRLLGLLGRCHTAAQARRTIEEAVRAGFPQVSADLLYGLPALRSEALREWVRELAALGVSHISAYSLELHPGTSLAEAVAAGRVPACGAEEEEWQWGELTGALGAEEYEAYEVSNFARQGSQCRHNCAYWDGSPYVGLGPGAHGYDPAHGQWGSRRWNAPGLRAYRDSVLAGELPPGERETLGREEALLEALFLSFRRAAPLDHGALSSRFGLDPRRLAAILEDLEADGLVHRLAGAPWAPTPSALRRADGLALWVRDLLLSGRAAETAA
jgi:oxygen-independent coproporphyrinogen III oxidase